MSDPVTEPTSVTPLTDEQLAEQFPGQDVAHLRSMMNVADGTTNAPAADAVEYPAYIPEKFRQGTVEEATKKMAESYTNLEKTLSGKPSAAPADPAPTADPATPADPAAPAGEVSLDSVQDEYLANDGVVAEESYAALEAKGMSRDMVDNYIEGQKAIAGQLITRVHAAAGGEQQYADLMQWAGDNWNDDQIAAYDTVMSGGSEAAIQLAVSGLKAAAGADLAGSPTLVQGQAGDPAVTGSYSSKQEMTADMKNPLYKTDPAFRSMVERKLSNSTIW